MLGVRPCPYCGGEVEVVKLIPVLHDKTEEVYRIECKRCRRLVARGIKFPDETDAEGAERILQYKNYQAKRFAPLSSRHFQQTLAAQQRDREAKYSSRRDPENEREYL